MQYSKYLYFFAGTFLCLFTSLSAKDLNVVIIGGGPTGLAAAIEAYNNGDKVTVIEKRNEYTRKQTLFLTEDSLKLIENWGVTIPELNILEINKNRKMGVVTIQDLENAFAKKLSGLGIHILHGEYKKLLDEKKIAVSIYNQNIDMPYDVLIAADGTHSTIRKELNIHTIILGKAQGAAIYLDVVNPAGKMDISTTIKKNDLYIKKISLPTQDIIFLQTSKKDQEEKKLQKEQFVTAAWYANWFQDAKSIVEDKVRVLNDFEVILQQAQTFSSEKRCVILIGDAAATASFFRGAGLNGSFKTSVAAGTFLKKLSANEQNIYTQYNKSVKAITDELINDSLTLWQEDPKKLKG